MSKRVMVLMTGCLAAVALWGKSFSLDLRAPSDVQAQVRAQANKTEHPLGAGDGLLRKAKLAAGRADVGEIAVGDELSFTLFDDVAISLTLAKQMPASLGGDAFLAEASGYEGVKNAVVLRTADGLTVDIQDYFNKKVYKVISTARGVTVQEIAAKGIGKCGCDTRPLQSPPEKSSARARKTAVAGATAKAKKVVAVKNAVPAETSVDILVAYDKNATTWANENGGGITNFAQVSVQKMNTALANTGLDALFRFRLAGVVGVEASTDNLLAAINAATKGAEDWSPVKVKRDEVDADIVTIMIDTGADVDTDEVDGRGAILTSENINGVFLAYSACCIRSVAQSHTMTHEVGHTMGCGHSDLHSTSPGPQLYPYSAGWYFKAEGRQYHTIMSYATEGPGGEGVPYFSSPNHTCQGVAVGDELHDNTLTLARTYPIAAAWRGGAREYVWEVAPSEDGAGCVITAVSPRPSGRLEIPAVLDGKPVVGIANSVFTSCEGLWSVNIPNSMTSVGNEAFRDCRGLTSVTIPASVTNIGAFAFYGCTKITEFAVADGNPSYKSVSGLLLTKDGSMLVAVPEGLTNVTVPDDVTSIGQYAFCNCRALESVVIPASVQTVWYHAFDDCFSLQEVYFLGDAPKTPSANIYSGTSSSLTTYVTAGSTGWQVPGSSALPERWPAASGDDARKIAHSDAYEKPEQEDEKPQVQVWRVIFDAQGGVFDGGSGGSSLAMVVTNGLVVGELPAATRNGYAFAGWWTTANGGSQVSNATVITEDTTFYAHWTASEPPPPPSRHAGRMNVGFGAAQVATGVFYYKEDMLAGTAEVKAGKINKKGQIKITASATLLMDGKAKKVTAKAVTVTLDAQNRIAPVTLAFKSPIGAMTFEMAADGTFTLKNASYAMASAAIGGALKGGARGMFLLGEFSLAVPGELQDDLLPYEEPFVNSGGKWTFAKNSSVKIVKDRATGTSSLVVDTSGGKTNRSSLKLSYVPKTGVFKGAFKAYSVITANGRAKLAKYTVNVIGFVVDGIGCGEATCKKPAGGPWDVTVK